METPTTFRFRTHVVTCRGTATSKHRLTKFVVNVLNGEKVVYCPKCDAPINVSRTNGALAI